MASKTRIRGITIELGADTSGLDKALKGVNSQLKTTQSALNDVNKLLKLNPGNVTLLQQKQKNLTQAIEETRQKLKSLKSVQRDSVSPEQWDAVQREIIETENNLKSLTKELKQFGSVGAQQVAAVGKKLSTIGQKLKDVGQKMTTYVTLPIIAGFTAAANSASDYEENINKLEVAFGKYAKEVQDFTDNALDQYGLSKLAASEAAASFGALAKGMDLSEKQAAALSKNLTGLSADLASYFNMSNEDAALLYDQVLQEAKELMLRKNHDYGEAWREMSKEGIVDMILAKIIRIKTILDNNGKTIASEGVEGNYFDIINYAIFDLIHYEN